MERRKSEFLAVKTNQNNSDSSDNSALSSRSMNMKL